MSHAHRERRRAARPAKHGLLSHDIGQLLHSAAVTGYPQDEMVAVAAAGSAPTIPAGLLMAK